GRCPPVHGCAVRAGSRATAARNDAARDRGPVAPTALLGRVLHLGAAGDPTRCAGRVPLSQAGPGVGRAGVVHLTARLPVQPVHVLRWQTPLTTTNEAHESRQLTRAAMTTIAREVAAGFSSRGW